ncbi:MULTISPECIES: hypothetical protein [Haloferax]|uniref:SRPBCC family protein n=1 Tax=Haloferax marinum TaxID=2666143 RepID=A0A6A8G8H4_9EURY|nr:MULTISPECIES: hypothetical protein [Haloferax]KAB1197804.1 hypothetical protein Hfx1150_09835 [Haloferax sp. CBA1150]MRW96862.1 hypothetical protein [Haloferax marinum]
MSERTNRRERPEIEQSMLIDSVLATFDVTQIRHVVVDASPAETYRAVLGIDFMQMGTAVRILNELRALPERLSARLRGERWHGTPASVSLDDLVDSTGYVVLGDREGDEFVFGAVGKFWRPTIEWVDIEPGEFVSFDRPGYAKLAIGFSVRPYGTDRTLLSYEARTATTDPEARRRFRLYWSVIGPFAGVLMQQALAHIKAEAEQYRIPVR